MRPIARSVSSLASDAPQQYARAMLPPTSPRLLDPGAIPYFRWDDRMTLAQARVVLAGRSSSARDELIARILREANTRDVWLFLDWAAIDDAWPRIERRLGRARGLWKLIRSRHLEQALVAAP
jgi:hypothetical protein